MEFRNLKKQYQILEKPINEAIRAIMQQANFIGGNAVAELEAELAEYVGMPYCVCCANGTDALKLALMAWGIGPGDAVFVPDFTFFASGEVVVDLGATPVFVDISTESYNIDVDKLKEMIEKVIQEGDLVPKVILAVDLFGQPADFIRIEEISRRYNLKVLEDGAQGFGGNINGKKACSFGDIATTSFFPAKPLGCYGDGGAVFLRSQEEYDLVRSYQVHGKGTNKYDNVRIGMNSRLDAIQAAILKVKFDAFKQYELEQINQYALFYSVELKDIVKIPEIVAPFYSSWAQYTIQLNDQMERDGLQQYLKQFQIPTMVYYPKPMHSQTAFMQCGVNYLDDDYVVTNRLCGCVLALPISPYIEENEMKEVIFRIKEYLD